MRDEASIIMDILGFLSASLPVRAKTALFAFVLLISPPLARSEGHYDLTWDMQTDYAAVKTHSGGRLFSGEDCTWLEAGCRSRRNGAARNRRAAP